MAGQADGSIVIDTELDTQGFSAGSKEIQRAIRSLQSKVEGLGPTMRKAVSGSASALESFDDRVLELRQTISALKQRMEELGDKRLPTDDYQWLQTEAEKAGKELDKLLNKQAKMSDAGVKKNSRAWKNLQYDIDQAKRKLEEYKAEMRRMEDAGSAFTTGADTAEYDRLNAALQDTQSQLDKMTSRVNRANSSCVQFAKTVGGTVVGAVVKCAAAMLRLSLRAKKTHSSFSSGLKTMLRYGLGVRSLFVLINKLRTALVEGYKNLARYSRQTNAAISSIMSALTRLKNSFASAFNPILTNVAPALVTLINLISEAVSRIGMLTAALTGAKTYTKAVEVQEDYAASLGNTASAAKEAKKALAGFDELNILSDNTNETGSSAGTVDPSAMFEQAPIDSAVLDFADKLREAFENADWKGLGELLGNKFNELVDCVDWYGLGSKLGYCLNAAIQTLYYTIDTIDWVNLGGHLGEAVNGIIDQVDFDIFGRLLAKKFTVALDTLGGLLGELDWTNALRAFTSGFSGFYNELLEWIESKNWREIGETVTRKLSDALQNGNIEGAVESFASAFTAAINAVADFLDGVDFYQLGSDIVDMLVHAVSAVDWSALAQALGRAIAEAGIAALDFCGGLVSNIADYFQQKIDEGPFESVGENIAYGILTGISNAFAGIFVWIFNNVFKPIWNGICDAFEIHSPSQKMVEIGQYIIAGLVQGIQGAISSVVTAVTGVISDIKSKFASTDWKALGKDLISKIKAGVESVASTLPNAIKTIGDNVKKKLTGIDWAAVGKSIIQAIYNGFVAVQTALPNAIKTIGDNVKKKLTGIDWKTAGKTVIQTIYNGFVALQTTVPNALKKIGDAARKKFEDIDWITVGKNVIAGIKQGITKAIATLTTAAQQASDWLITAFKNALGIHSPSTKGATLGYWWDVGVANGMDDNAYLLADSAEELGYTIIDGMDDVLDGAGADLALGLIEETRTTLQINMDRISDALSSGSGVSNISGLVSAVKNGDWATVAKNVALGIFNSMDTNFKENVSGFVADALEALNQGFDEQGYVGMLKAAKGIVGNLISGLNGQSGLLENAGSGMIGSIVKGIQGALGSLWDLIAGIVQKIISLFSGGFSGIQETGSKLISGLGSLFQKGFASLNTTSSGGLSSIGKAFNDCFTNIASNGNGLFSKLSTLFSGGLAGIKATASNVLSSIGSVFSNGFSGIASGASALVSKLGSLFSMGGVKTAVSGAVSSIGGLFSGGMAGVASTVGAAMSSVGSAIGGTLSGAAATAAGALSGIGTAAATALGTGGLAGLAVAGGAAIAGLSSKLNNYAAQAKAAAQESGSSFKAALWSIVEAGTWLPAKTFEIGKSLITNLANGIKSVASGVVSTAKSVGSGIINGIKSVASGAVSVGKNIISGIGNGIKSVASGVVNTVKNVGSSIFNGIKSFFGIHSPSTLMADGVGAYLPPGIGVGIKKAMPALLSDTADQMDDLVDTVEAGALAADTALTGSGVPLLSEVTGKVDIVNGMDEVLTSFSDKVAGSFSDLLDRLAAITENVTFTMPDVAAGTVVPYSVASGTENSTSATDVAEEIKLSNDELSRLIVQAIGSATTSICAAIERYSGTEVNLDINSISQGVIDNINARIRMTGKSPILAAAEV